MVLLVDRRIEHLEAFRSITKRSKMEETSRAVVSWRRLMHFIAD